MSRNPNWPDWWTVSTKVNLSSLEEETAYSNVGTNRSNHASQKKVTMAPLKNPSKVLINNSKKREVYELSNNSKQSSKSLVNKNTHRDNKIGKQSWTKREVQQRNRNHQNQNTHKPYSWRTQWLRWRMQYITSKQVTMQKNWWPRRQNIWKYPVRGAKWKKEREWRKPTGLMEHNQKEQYPQYSNSRKRREDKI